MGRPNRGRDNNIHVRASADEVRMLERLADRAGITSSDWIRTAIRSAYADTFGVTPRANKRARPAGSK